MVQEHLDLHMKKINLDTDIIYFTKVNSQRIRNLNSKCKAIKLPKDNTEKKNLDDPGYDNDFLNIKKRHDP